MTLATGVAVALLALPALASAQLFNPDDDFINKASAIARANLDKARLSNGQPVPKETAEELARPIVPAELDAQTVRRGSLSGEMQVCGMDWLQESFRPYMAKLRAGNRYNDKQLAYLGMLHGVSQGVVYNAMRQHVRSCSAGTKKQLSETAVLQLGLALP